MLDNGWMIFGGGAALATVATLWGKLRAFFSYVISFVVVSIELHDQVSQAALVYLRSRFSESRFGPKTYIGWNMLLRAFGRRQLVSMEVAGKGAKLFWKRWWLPIWLTRTSSSGNETQDQSVFHSRPVRISFLRGTISPDRFIVEATDYYNSIVSNAQNFGRRRYAVIPVHGTDGKPARINPHGVATPDAAEPATEREDFREILGHRLLQWKWDDIGPDVSYNGKALDRMALNSEMETAVEYIRRWVEGRQWHRDRGIPWKRGYGLYGAPGTGKTAFVRAVAEDFDLPVYSFDLTTLYNDKLKRKWLKMLANTPCIALIEDIDAVFEGRENRHGHLSFDCLLNCIDGIERSDGLLLFITTNFPEKLDDALGGAQGFVSRPGRIDHVIEMRAPDSAGRRKIARRILCDWPAEIDVIVSRGDGQTGAQFEQTCTERALELYWGDESTREMLQSRQCPPLIPTGR